MSATADFVVRAILIGIGATVVMDVWTVILKRVFGVATLDYALVGRWLGHIPHGQLAHAAIGNASPVPGERAIGWAAHYAIGIAFAALLLAVAGLDWAHAPSPLPALVVGLATIVAPFGVMQPAMGSGFAASRTPSPWRARLRSVITHTVFGIGLYESAVLVAALI